MRKLFHFHGGIHPTQHKDLSTAQPIAIARLPRQVVLSLSQHSGAAAVPVVEVGQRVRTGELVARADGKLSAAVHASISGTVSAIESRAVPHPSGMSDRCIVIDSDGEDRWIDAQPIDYRNLPAEDVLQQLSAMGLVGLGGAAFPSHIKLATNGSGALRTVVINGSECEPYISCDDMLMRERALDVVAGINLIRHLLGAQEALVGIEDNKPQAIAAMQAAATTQVGVDIVPIPTIYPGGGEKQLIRTLTGIEVPAGRYPHQYGVACFNAGTAYAIHRAINLGLPLVSRIVTVSGNVAQPRNYEVRLGTSMAQMLALAGEHANSDGHLMGGPMMGFRLASSDVPVVKATNCIIATSAKLFPKPAPEMPCIRCGQCALYCPADLQPFELYWYAKSKDVDKAKAYNLLDCIECGVCNYVCPSRIPLVQYYRHAKGELRERERERQAAQQARTRFEAHEARLEQDHARERERLEQLSAQATDSKQSAVDAALARARARRSANE